MVEGTRSSLAIQSQALLSKVLLPCVRKRLTIQVIYHDVKSEENDDESSNMEKYLSYDDCPVSQGAFGLQVPRAP